MKKLSTRETVILFITLGLVLAFIIFQWVIKPMQGSAIDIDDQFRLNHAHLVKARKMVAIKQEVEARYQNLVDVIGTAASEASQMTAMVSKIESTARDANVHIANIQPQKAVTQKEVTFFPVELQIDGQWLDIVRFLYMLQQKPNLYFIDELNVEKYSDAVNTLRGRIVVSSIRLVNF
ncbi:MAG: type 4a pilus biogenesis protein PilO [Candidatus Omnitrophica bacterium]|nr:type 4a pilus biogenesis protein PilO [Candidatus Omnitrophota bacterium]